MTGTKECQDVYLRFLVQPPGRAEMEPSLDMVRGVQVLELVGQLLKLGPDHWSVINLLLLVLPQMMIRLLLMFQ